MDTHLILQKGQKLFLLLKNAEDFHLVSVDKRLTAEVEEKLLASYPCSDASLRELGINFQRLTPRGVAVGGNEAGDPIILYVGKEKRKFVLSDDYDPDVIGAFFADLEWFTPPKQKHKKNPDAWRLEEQDPALVPPMKKLQIFLTLVSIGSSILMLFEPIWGLLGIFSSVACVVLDIRFPAYFTLMDLGKGSGPEHAIGLALAASVPVFAQGLYIINRCNFHPWWPIWLWSAALGILIGVLIGRYAREFRNRGWDAAALVLMLVMFFQGPIGLVNLLADRSEPRTDWVQIQDMYVSEGGSSADRYYCVIPLEDGTEFDLQIPLSCYEELFVGDNIQIVERSGGLGFGYISLVED